MTAKGNRAVLPAPYAKQREFLALKTRRRAFIAGVGAGKTFTLCLTAVISALRQPNVLGGIFFPSMTLWEDVGLPTWEEVVPPQLYTWHRWTRRIEFVNGATIIVKGLDRSRSRIKGLNLGWACMDEVAVHKDAWPVKLVGQRIRRGREDLRHLSIFSSPAGHHWVREWCEHPSTGLVRATTYDNRARLGEDYITACEADFPPGSKEHAQEMLGEFVSLSGLVYGDIFSRARHTVDWPGDQAGDYALSVDYGWRASAWLVWQKMPSGSWCVVDEYLPEQELTEDVALKIMRDRGRAPALVRCDVPASRSTSRAHVNDDDALRDVFGRRCKVHVVGGYERSSDWRHKAVVAGLNSGQLRVSSRLIPQRPRPGERGLVHALESCEWPDESSRDERRDEKDRLKHVLDALEFGAAAFTPPKMGRPRERYGSTMH